MDEEYVACFNCGEVVPKNFKFCPHCGRRLFHPQTSPLLLVSAGLYFLNAISSVFPSPHTLYLSQY
ncbi:MAG: zinc-ribbon domain-containing protein [Candidatus Bathycorpusculaceae bacterium]